MATDDDIDNDWAVDSTDPNPPPHADREGPPDDWDRPTWFDFKRLQWWWKPSWGPWRQDPPPITALGHRDGLYYFVTPAGEHRGWKSAALHGRGGLADLFGGDLRWATRHFPGRDKDKNLTGRPNVGLCMERLIGVCTRTRYLDGTVLHRGAGVWLQDEEPLIHAGNRIFHNGEILPPGTLLGDMLYTVGGNSKPPAHAVISEPPRPHLFEWSPATAAQGLGVMSDLDAWHWQSEEDRQLFAGGLFMMMLGDAPAWKNHVFVQAPPEAGKSHLLKYAHALLAGSAGPLLRTYSKAYIERRYSGMGKAIVLDESESDTEADRIKNLFELFRLLNDDGATGGRAAEGGSTREFDVHGPVLMAATVRERWRPQDRRRIVILRLLPLLERNQKPEAKETVARLILGAGDLGPALCARAVDRWPHYLKNFAIAHAQVMKLGGTSGDGDQLGGLIAGWWTLTRDDPPDQELIDDVARFAEFIRSKIEAEAGDDDPTDCFNYLLGAEMKGVWRSGELYTVGQTIARARDDSVDADNARRALHAKGLRLIPPPASDGWNSAWLAIANKHNGLNEIFEKAPEYGRERWNQIMAGLPGVQTKHPFDPSNPAPRFAGPQRRALFVPPVLLPLLSDERG